MAPSNSLLGELELHEIAKRMRRQILKIASKHGGHVGGSLSVIDLLVFLFGSWMNVAPELVKDDSRDRFILSKGHCSLALYSVLEEFGFIESGEVETFMQFGSRLPGHVEHFHLDCVEMTTGSLGHGVAAAVGVALGGKIKDASWSVYTVLGDGECNEGSVWEAISLASQLKLNNILFIVDNNRMESLDFTSDILNVEPLHERFASFGCDTYRVDGNDFSNLIEIFSNLPRTEKPIAIIADTTKGKGISFIENSPKWHYRAPSETELDLALQELESFE